MLSKSVSLALFVRLMTLSFFNGDAMAGPSENPLHSLLLKDSLSASEMRIIKKKGSTVLAEIRSVFFASPLQLKDLAVLHPSEMLKLFMPNFPDETRDLAKSIESLYRSQVSFFYLETHEGALTDTSVEERRHVEAVQLELEKLSRLQNKSRGPI